MTRSAAIGGLDPALLLLPALMTYAEADVPFPVYRDTEMEQCFVSEG